MSAMTPVATADMPIRLLDRDVASKIAAGEVIERPSSVVKELMENALDAGAGQVEIELVRGGLELIRVTDDAGGIPEDELELAVQRHATSKLRSTRDLSTIETLGFRGEALASIAAVARVTLVSRVPGTDGGHYLILTDNEVIERGRQGAPPGTTLFVRELFKAVPARLAFLRSASAEGARCVQVVTQYALAHPDVAVRAIVDGRLAFHSPGNGDARDGLVEMWGADTVAELLPILETRVGGTTVTGFAGPPTLTRPRRTGQILFINGRLIEERILSYAIADAYKDMMQRGRYPLVVLFVAVPPDDVDVNVHPTKAEIRLRREGEVIAAVQRAIRRTLAAHDVAVPALQDGASSADGAAQIPSAPADSDVELTAPPLMPPMREPDNDASSPSGSSPPRFVLRPVGQVGLTYIVAEGPEGIYLIDQHAAHERVVFEQILAARQEEAPAVQGLLEAATIQLTRRQLEALASLGDLLSPYGFDWEPFGDDAILLRGMPASLRESAAADALLEVLDESRRDEATAPDGSDAAAANTVDSREWHIVATIACHSTVRAGQTLSSAEMDALLKSFQAANFPRLCPHGRPTMVHLSQTQLERQFGRR